MPKDAKKIVSEINDAMKRKNAEVVTYLWSDFYTLCGMQRWREEKGRDIVDVAKNTFGLTVGYGHSVVVIAHDRPFAPA